ncbi:hypothetical protein CPC08DRAFT_558397 [Agrocybe pediades]|nr:hypothetical protein CPC08DRAFT_558397 [Agrocybe pediades]
MCSSLPSSSSASLSASSSICLLLDHNHFLGARLPPAASSQPMEIHFEREWESDCPSATIISTIQSRATTKSQTVSPSIVRTTNCQAFRTSDLLSLPVVDCESVECRVIIKNWRKGNLDVPGSR